MSENQRVRLTKKMLENSLVELLKTTPLSKISIKELCSHAQINRTTFYKYYGSQYDLLDEIEKNVGRDIAEIVSSKSPSGKMRAMLVYMDTNSEIILTILNNRISSSQFLQNSMIETQLIEITKDCYTDEEYPFVKLFLVSGQMEIIYKWLNTGRKQTVDFMEKLITKLADNVLGGNN